MTDVRFTVRVERDLIDIGDFIAAMRQHCLLLATSPLMGRARPDLGLEIRSFPHPPYTVFYRFRAAIDRVEVLRVWHGRRPSLKPSDLGIRS